MGILDDIFGTNTSSAQTGAASNADSLIAAIQAQNAAALQNSATNASGAINAGATSALGALGSNYGNASGALTNYGGQAQGALSSGISNAVQTAQGSNANYQPYASSGSAASGMLSNALGLNGASGNAAATSAFQAAPGYQYQVQQSTDAAQRAAAAAGLNASGNTLQAITALGSNLANQGYQTWLSNLQNAGSQGLTAAAGISGNNQAAAGLQGVGATTGANLLQNTGTSLGSLDQALGNNSANVYTGQGTNLANIQTNLGNALVNNNDWAVGGIDSSNLGAAKAQDSASNTNAGILSNLFKNAGSAALGFL